jgi:iron complex outermembrane receptor protein
MRKGWIIPRYLLLVVFLIGNITAFAQNRITGKVTDPNGAGIEGATIAVKGGRNATQTAADGTFNINASTNSTLVISSVGFATQEIALNGRSSIDVSMTTANAQMNEVVLIGYGSKQKKDLTGSVTQITSKDFQQGTITTPEQLISGKVAGVAITSNGGQPGSGSTIRIRGGSSLRASNDPLLVIDGVPMSNDGIAGAPNQLSFINPNDIESFTILKDASAAAIYGTRASNGVILITTKKGRSDKLRVNFSTVNSIANIYKTVDVLSANQVRSIVSSLGTAGQKAMVGNANTDWQNEIYQNAFTTDNNISITGGIKKLPYRLSLGYLNQEGTLKTDLLRRGNVSIVLNPVLLDGHLKIDVNLKGSMQKNHFANQGAIGTAVYFDPTQPVFSNTKRFSGYFEWLDASGAPNTLAARNPLSMLYGQDNNSDSKRGIANIQIDYTFHWIPELRANLNLGVDYALGKGSNFISDSSSLAYNVGGSSTQYRQIKNNSLLEFYLAYARDINSIKSRFDVMAGYSYNNYLTTNYNFKNYNARGVQIGADPNFPFNKPENTLLSYFGRLNFTINDKYLFTATARRDGSSRFGPVNKYGFFPSAAFSWRIKQESFLKNSNVITDMKLRLGYGITGQQDGIPNYDFLSVYSLSNQSASYGFGTQYFQGYRPSAYNPFIKWEETATSNIGLDWGLFNNRISGSLDFYLKKTSDLLNEVPQAAGTNFSAYLIKNVGDMENKGVEFNLNVQPVKSRNLNWDVSFNATYNKNTITNLTVNNDPNYIGFPTTNISGVQGFAFLNAVGGPKNTFYLYHQVYDPTTGRPLEGLFEDANRDGIINENDKYKGFTSTPDWFLGFSTNITYNKWNAGFVMRANFNNYLYNNVYSNNGRLNQVLGSQTTGNASVNYLETLFKGNTDQELLSDYYIQNGSFLKMDNLNIGYNAGKVFHNRAGLRLNFTVQNVFTITNYTGLDPEIGGGVDNNIYPRPRVFSLGINLDILSTK